MKFQHTIIPTYILRYWYCIWKWHVPQDSAQNLLQTSWDWQKDLAIKLIFSKTRGNTIKYNVRVSTMKMYPLSWDLSQAVVDYNFAPQRQKNINPNKMLKLMTNIYSHENHVSGSFGTTAKSVIKPATYDLNFGHSAIQTKSIPLTDIYKTAHFPDFVQARHYKVEGLSLFHVPNHILLVKRVLFTKSVVIIILPRWSDQGRYNLVMPDLTGAHYSSIETFTGSIHLLVDYLLLYWVYTSTGGLFIPLLGLYIYWWIIYYFTGSMHLLVDYLLLY